MKKVIVTLHSGPAQSIDIPADRIVERTCFGAIRLFPGLPKVVTEAEFEFIRTARPDLSGMLICSTYVESRRTDKRGCTETGEPPKPERRVSRRPARTSGK